MWNLSEFNSSQWRSLSSGCICMCAYIWAALVFLQRWQQSKIQSLCRPELFRARRWHSGRWMYTQMDGWMRKDKNSAGKKNIDKGEQGGGWKLKKLELIKTKLHQTHRNRLVMVMYRETQILPYPARGGGGEVNSHFCTLQTKNKQ